MAVGIDISKKYYEEYASGLKEEFSDIASEMAFGLVGEGSECFGFDDEISQDHDFGPGFCLWIPMEVYKEKGEMLQAAYNNLPNEMDGYKRHESPEAVGRRGVIPIEAFYQKFTGKPYGPEDIMDWFRLPEHFLAAATNGVVFEDGNGKFTEVRERLLGFYPDDIRRKKLAARVFKMAQAGQYNYPRMMKRGDKGASYLALAEFTRNALSAIFLIEKTYMPFYKWAFRKADELKGFKSTVEDLKKLIEGPIDTQREGAIENICMQIKTPIQEEGLSFTKSTFLIDDAMDIMRGIEADNIRNLPPDYDLA